MQMLNLISKKENGMTSSPTVNTCRIHEKAIFKNPQRECASLWSDMNIVHFTLKENAKLLFTKDLNIRLTNSKYFVQVPAMEHYYDRKRSLAFQSH